jgi:alpha-methylacyl-CoA racemase
MLDGAAHFYDSYECADGEYISLGSIEPQFYALLKEKAGLDEDTFADQHNSEAWPELTEKLAEVFKTKTQAQWCELMEGSDVCFAPVLNFIDAPKHPANIARDVYIDVDGITQPAPAPRFSRTPSEVRHGAHAVGADTQETLAAMGFESREIEALKEAEVIG